MSETFEAWSERWKRLKERTGETDDIEAVLKEWKNVPPPQSMGRPFPINTGSRKNYVAPRGEQRIELLLLGPKNGKPLIHPIAGASIPDLSMCAIFNNFAAARLKSSTKGQIIADAFGILKVGPSYHPLSIEVKVSDGNAWRAVVQCLQQVRFFRAAGRDLRERLANIGSEFLPKGTALKGAWGMVLAPPVYWQRKSGLSDAAALLQKLTERTKGRVLLASINDDGAIQLVGGHMLP